MTEIMALSLAAALSALASWMSFRPTPRTIIATSRSRPAESPVANEMVASTASRITSGLSTACQSSLPKPGPLVLGQHVGAVLGEARRRLLAAEPLGAGRQECIYGGGRQPRGLDHERRHADGRLFMAGEDALRKDVAHRFRVRHSP